MNKGNKVIGDKKQEISGKITSAVTLSGVSPKSPYGFFAFAQNDLQRSNRHAELVSASRGRSMVEMLGVLAIIGMLSIGALVGVKFAFDGVKANNLLNDVRLYAAAITHNDYDLDTQEFNPTTEFAFWAEWIEERNVVFAVNAEEVPKGVCNSAKNKAKNEYIVHINGTENGNCNDENNQIKFIMNGQDICSKNCPTTCCDGVCCPSNEHTCVDGKCYLAGDCEEDQNACGAGCCDKGNSCCSGNCCMGLQVCCGGQCCESGECLGNAQTGSCCEVGQKACGSTCCEINQICSDGLCCGFDVNGVQLVNKNGSCGCPDDLRTYNAETNSCDCPAETPNFYGEDKGGPLCCQAGYIPFQGSCTQLTCSGGTEGGKNWFCHLNNISCGSWCNSDGTNCGRGICWESLCPDDTTFKLMDPNFWSGGERYGCQYSQKTSCYAGDPGNESWYGGNYNIACWNEKGGSLCCFTDKNFECYNGICEEEFCTNLATDEYSATLDRITIANSPACRFTSNDGSKIDVECGFSDNSFFCVNVENNQETTCANSCANPPYCDGKCGNPATCPEDMQLNEDDYCYMELDGYTIYQSRTFMENMYIKENDEYAFVGRACSATQHTCAMGGLPESRAQCPDGWTFERITSENGMFGCSAPNGMEHVRTNNLFTCYYNKVLCGKNCDNNCQNCTGGVLLTECMDVYTDAGGNTQLYYEDSNGNAVSVSSCPSGQVCYEKRQCAFNSAVTGKCVCTTNPSANVGDMCCATGQTVQDGQCVVEL